MYVNIYGENKTVKDIWLDRQTCNSCGNVSYFHLYKIKYVVYMLFAKIFSKTLEYCKVCDHCKHIYRIDKKVYNALKNQQIDKLMSGTIDQHIILSEFSPKQTGFSKKKFKYVFGIAWLAMFIIGTIGMVSDIAEGGNLDMSVPFGAVFMLTIGAAPFLAFCKPYKIVKKQKELYIRELEVWRRNAFPENTGESNVQRFSRVWFACPKCGNRWEEYAERLSDIRPRNCRRCGYDMKSR